MKRRKFLSTTFKSSVLFMSGNSLNTFVQETQSWEDQGHTMPVLFVGHGAPLYTLDDNQYSRAWKKIAEDLPIPKAVVCISAHWLTRGSHITAMAAPKTIHDFGRMDDRLFEIEYKAPGSPELANLISEQLTQFHVEEDHKWGFDHGCWCVVRHMYPEANIPVLQFSIDYYKGGEYLYNLASQLGFLRKKGILILASGNIVHNLRRLRFPEETKYDWAIEADEQIKGLIEKGDHKSLIRYEKLGKAANLSIPTPDHYYPLLYALALKTEKDKISFPIEGITYGSTSMRSVLIESA